MKKHTGSTLESFFEEKGIREKVDALTRKKIMLEEEKDIEVFTQRELNRLTFMAASCVASPELTVRIVDVLLKRGDENPEIFTKTLQNFRMKFVSLSTITLDHLYTVAKDLMKDSDKNIKTLGLELCAAIEFRLEDLDGVSGP